MSSPTSAKECAQCAHCAGPFAPARPSVRYCSTRCAGLAKRTLPEPDPRPCERCGTEFTPPRKYQFKQRFCSGYCSRCAVLRTDDPIVQAARSRERNAPAKLFPPRPDVQILPIRPKGYRKTGGRLLHRVIAEHMLGRALLPSEVVHHIDGDPRNNDPSNLQVLASSAEHARLHAEMRRCAKVVMPNAPRHRS